MRPACLCLFLLAAGWTAQAQVPLPGSENNSAVATNLLPPLPTVPSPVEYFRQLLVMTPAERSSSLTNRPPEARAKILTKVREYQALGPDERELRLRATELRWYLTPLLSLPVEQREARLAQVPDDLRALVQSRLTMWDGLPPGLQQELLANDKTLRYFTHVNTTNTPPASRQQQKIAEQFNLFFELTPNEKQQALNSLSEAERAAMQKTLDSFSQLPPKQRTQCLHNYAKFASMSADERTEFLKSAEKWSQMSPKERQTWRDLVAHVPQWPPMPPPTVPPNLFPHTTPKIPRTSLATNAN